MMLWSFTCWLAFISIVLVQPYFLGNLSWRKTQHFTHVHGHLQRANGDLWERPDCEDLGHDTSSWLQPCHWLLFPLISSVAGLCTLCTAICTEWMESSSRILLQTLVAWFSSCCCSRMDSHLCRAQLFCWAPRESPWCSRVVPQPLGLTSTAYLQYDTWMEGPVVSQFTYVVLTMCYLCWYILYRYLVAETLPE